MKFYTVLALAVVAIVLGVLLRKKALVVIGVIVATPVLMLFGMLWLAAASTPDQSALSREVGVTILDYHKEQRASSTDRFGYRVGYAYRVDATAYADEQFIPLRSWEPGWPLEACVDPGSPAEHALRVHYDPPCGSTYVGEQQTAKSVEGG